MLIFLKEYSKGQIQGPLTEKPFIPCLNEIYFDNPSSSEWSDII